MAEIILFVIAFAILMIVAKFIIKFFRLAKGETPTPLYEKKPYLFDANSEFVLYKLLLELFGDEYFVFPQVNYGHLIQPKKTNWGEERSLRSRIDRKSADFVLCDKEQVIPCLVIELDGTAHDLKKKKERDEFINELTQSVGLPLLRLKVGDTDRESVKEKVTKSLEAI